jgi:hypothetical protein
MATRNRGCGPGVCLDATICTKNRCKLPVGPTVDSAADMMSSAVLARTGTGLMPRITIGKKGAKITRPAHHNVTLADNLMAWTGANLCCSANRLTTAPNPT